MRVEFIAYRNGYEAFRSGLVTEDCPYPQSNGLARRQWLEGYLAAMRAARMS